MVGELSCENCGVGYGADDIFCENCGYDFITGSLPSGDEAMAPSVAAPAPAASPDAGSTPGAGEPAPGAPAPGEVPDTGPSAVGIDPAQAANAQAANGGAPAPAVRVNVSVDQTYFEAVVSEGELEFPGQPAAPTEIELTGNEFHVGRTSQSRAIHPDLDIAQLSGDPAVSSRHAVIRVTEDGAVTVTDVGSTNGTFVGAVDSKAITVGEPVAVVDSSPIYVGAWTRLEVTLRDA